MAKHRLQTVHFESETERLQLEIFADSREPDISGLCKTRWMVCPSDKRIQATNPRPRRPSRSSSFTGCRPSTLRVRPSGCNSRSLPIHESQINLVSPLLRVSSIIKSREHLHLQFH
jgi:hypothetical protein